MSTLGERAVRALQGIRPPKGYRNWMREHGMCDGEVLTCRCVSKAEAEGYELAEGVYDARYAEHESIPEGRSAVLTCSSCGGQTLVRYRPGEKDSRGFRQPPTIEWWSPTDGTSLVQDIGHNMMCPQCGWECRLRRASEMTHGIPEISWIVTAHRMEDTLYLVKWHIERRLFERREEWTEKAVEALCFDGRQKARLTQYRRFLNGYIFEGWSERARFDDTVGRCVFCPEDLPSLEGTALENCRLREFAEATEGTESCCPAAWLRLWEKHKNAEVLIDAGLGRLISEMLVNGCRVPVYYGYGTQERWRAPKMKGIDWKKRRPAAMLGMTAPELARARKEVRDGKTLEFLLEHKGRATELLDLLTVTGGFLEAGAVLKISGEKKPMWAAGYLKKQGRRAVYLADYRRMAEACGLDLAHERVRWPKDLTRAHDEAADLERKLKREKEAAENAGRWAAMNERLQGLAWARGGICIRPAASTEELVKEGKVLHHCVGGYTDTHLRGNIILFVRHERRPERSWFTLNIDLENRTRIQLHGYGNERANGKELRIPKEVLEFVDAWEKEVLANWRDPEKMKGKKHGDRTAAA